MDGVDRRIVVEPSSDKLDEEFEKFAAEIVQLAKDDQEGLIREIECDPTVELSERDRFNLNCDLVIEKVLRDHGFAIPKK